MKKWIESIKDSRADDKLENALSVLKAEIEKNPDDPVLNLEVAWVLTGLNEKHEAIPVYIKAIQLGLSEQDSIDAYYGLGECYMALSELQKAQHIYEEAILKFPHFRPFKVFLSLSLIGNSKSSEAYQILIRELLETTSDLSIKCYERSLLSLAQKI